MGNNSFLRALRNNSNQCIIDWDHMRKDHLLHHRLQDYHSLPVSERPKTLEDMAHVWNETKFIGYLDENYVHSLKEFCKGLVPYGSNPRLYYEYEGCQQIWCLEFVPGIGIINIACYDYSSVLASLPRCPEDSSEFWNEWHKIYCDLERYLIKYCIDNNIWKYERLV